jgi:hypothetical protein
VTGDRVARKYLFIDESGNLDFSGKASASTYFILTSVASDSYDPAMKLLQLRHDLVLEGEYDGHCFHATEDKQDIRNRVFSAISTMNLRIDATIFDKARAYEHLRRDDTFYELAWYMHLKYVIPRVSSKQDDLIIFAATLQTTAKRQEFAKSLSGTVSRIGGRSGTTKVVFWPAQCDHGIQVADYCAWAIQRKWERNDDRSYRVIEPFIKSEFEIFGNRKHNDGTERESAT